MEKSTLDVVLAIVQIAALIFLIIYVWKTWEMASATKKAAESSRETVEEMKAGREAEYRPYVVAYFELVRNNIVVFTVKNAGKTEAREISITFEPELNVTDRDKIRSILTNSFGRFSLQPQQKLTTYIDQISRYLKGGAFPKSYQVKVVYRHGPSGQQYEESFQLDLGVYEGLLVLDEKDIAALVDKLEFIKNKAASIDSSLKKIAANHQHEDGDSDEQQP